MLMKYLLICSSLIFSTLFAKAPSTEKYPWTELDTQTRNVLDLIAQDKLYDALLAIKELEKKNSVDIPYYDCLRAAVFYKINEEYKSREFETDFEDSIKKAVDSLENESKDKEKGNIYKAKRLQFLGSAYGYRGMFRTLSGLWASAFFDGKRGADALGDSLTLDPSLVDNKAGIGTYLYWRSAKAGLVKYVLLWGDKKKEGINGLKAAVADGKIVKEWALGGLLRIYIEERDWFTALEYANQILKEYPNDGGTLRRKAMILYMMGKKADALNLLKDVLLPHFQSLDNTILYGKKTMSTANTQIELIYRILKINNDLGGKLIDKDTKAKYLSDVGSLKKRITPSFSDIQDYVNKINGL